MKPGAGMGKKEKLEAVAGEPTESQDSHQLHQLILEDKEMRGSQMDESTREQFRTAAKEQWNTTG